MNLFLDYTTKQIHQPSIQISGSKSESNRLLILQQLYPNLTLENVSDSDDSNYLTKALRNKNGNIDIGHAGTAMRFLSAYFATQEGAAIKLTGSERMQNRPIKILIDALVKLGADISYVKKEGYPPLQIKGKQLSHNKIAIQGNVSSQYISALLLIAPSLKEGLEVELLDKITSRPYLEMTLTLLRKIGIPISFKGALIKIKPRKQIAATTIVVESDWSSASYFYSLVALSPIGAQISLSSYRKDSLQGDSCLVQIYEQLGVYTSFNDEGITIHKKTEPSSQYLNLDLINAPDIAQTIAISCFGLGIACNLEGLHTLKIKETDRLVALNVELKKLGAIISVGRNSLQLEKGTHINENCSIATYHDHRMAMAFAPLALKVPITIEDADVVTKSYRTFWEDIDRCF